MATASPTSSDPSPTPRDSQAFVRAPEAVWDWVDGVVTVCECTTRGELGQVRIGEVTESQEVMHGEEQQVPGRDRRRPSP
jgi:hypothetical protein